MSIDLIEIAQAWIIAAKPNETQKKLAQERYATCLKCEHYRKTRPVTHDEHCGHCFCPLNKKIFSAKFGSCELGNWDLVDSNYTNILNKPKKENSPTKNDKTII